MIIIRLLAKICYYENIRINGVKPCSAARLPHSKKVRGSIMDGNQEFFLFQFRGLKASCTLCSGISK